MRNNPLNRRGITSLFTAMLAALWLVLPLAGLCQSRPELELAEDLTKAFVERELDAVVLAFSPTLQAQMPASKLAEMHDALVTQGGDLRYILAAYGIPSQNGESRIAQAAVPVDFENLSVEVLLTWRAGKPNAGLTGFAVRPVSRRPYVRPGQGLKVEFEDASYVDREAFVESNLRFGLPGIPLDGKLVMPVEANEYLVPAVLLLPDRDMEDADGTMSRVKPLRDLAHGLGSMGIASLRFPRRMSVHRESGEASYTAEEDILADAAAAMRQLAARPEVDKAQMYILGFGFGGLVAPRVADRSPKIAGMILISPPAKYDVTFLRRLMEAEGHFARLDAKGRQALEGSLGYLDKESLPAEQIIGTAPASFWYSTADIDPVADVNDYRGDVMLLFGGKDYLVTPREYRLWGDLYRSRRKTDLRYFPLLNRWLMPSQLDGNPEERNLPAHIAPFVVDLTAEFINKN